MFFSFCEDPFLFPESGGREDQADSGRRAETGNSARKTETAPGHGSMEGGRRKADEEGFRGAEKNGQERGTRPAVLLAGPAVTTVCPGVKSPAPHFLSSRRSPSLRSWGDSSPLQGDLFDAHGVEETVQSEPRPLEEFLPLCPARQEEHCGTGGDAGLDS